MTNPSTVLRSLFHHSLGLLAVVLLLCAGNAWAAATYDQATVGIFASGSNPIEKSATAAPNDLGSFTNAITPAFSTNFGGIFNLPSALTSGTTLLRGTYGTGQGKRITVTPSTGMQNVTATGSFTPISGANAMTSTTEITGYNLAFGQPTEATTGVALPEAVVRIGFAALSRNAANGYPVDVTATVSFSDGTTQSATSLVSTNKSNDDTFFGFTAPSGLFITNLALACFSPGTATPVANRVCIDDLAFITGWNTPPPQVLNVSPFNYALVKATDGVQFDALSYQVPIPTAGISLVLNSNDVSAQLVITGDTTNRHVTFSGLVANQAYDMLITVSNEVGVATSYSHFYTMEGAFTLFDSGGFSDTGLYPPGTLLASTNAGCIWLPPVDAASIVDTGEPVQGQVLRQMQMGIDETTYLEFPPLASGTIRISFDARVSTPYARTIDLGLNAAGSGTQGSFVAWGVVTNEFGVNTGEFAYYNGSAWVPLAAVDSGWHHYELTNFVSGPGAGNFAVAVDGVVVGSLLPWRTVPPARTPMGRFRLASMRGAIMEYGDIDNLAIQGMPEVSSVAPPPQILNVSPANNAVIRVADGFQFDAFSYLPIEDAGIALVLNSNLITSQLTITGPATNRHALFTGLTANTVYEAVMVVSNKTGTVTNSSRFYCADPALALVAGIDFSDATLFPVGPLGAVGTNGWSWAPPADAAQVVDTSEPVYGPALRMTQMGGADQQARLTFPPTLSGVIRVAFDARVSNPFSRTLDMSVDTAGGGQQSSFLGWGVVTNAYGTNSGQLAYYDGSAWVALKDMDTAWHHYEIVNYCSGPHFSKFNLTIDGAVVGSFLPWRHGITVQTPLAILRIGASRGAAGDYGELDNILVSVSAALTAPGAVRLQNPVLVGGAFSFTFASQPGVLYTAQSLNSLGGSPNTLLTILGDGSVKTVTDSNLSGAKFYRVIGQ